MRNVNIAYGTIFLLFSIAYVFFFQKDFLLNIASSLGFQTGNDIFYVGASIFLLFLFALSFLVKRLTSVNGIISSLCCFPALFIMGVLTSSESSASRGNILDLNWLWLLPAIIILYFLILFAVKRLFYYEISKERGFLSLANWNFTLLFIQFIITLFIGNTNLLAC